MPNPYIHNKKGRAAAWKCGCKECMAALGEYEAREDAIFTKGMNQMNSIIRDYEKSIREDERRKVLDELGVL